MSVSVVRSFYDAMRSMDPAALAAALSDDVVIVEPPSLPYGGTTTSRDEFFAKVLGYTSQRASFQVNTSQVFGGDGARAAGQFTATFTAHGSGETVVMDQSEVYEVKDGAISRVQVYQADTQALIDFFSRNAPVS